MKVINKIKHIMEHIDETTKWFTTEIENIKKDILKLEMDILYAQENCVDEDTLANYRNSLFELRTKKTFVEGRLKNYLFTLENPEVI